MNESSIKLPFSRWDHWVLDVQLRFHIWIPYILGISAFFIYLMSGLAHFGSLDFDLYPFGTDVPHYLRAYENLREVDQAVIIFHPLTIAMIRSIHALWSLFSIHSSDFFICKVLFAFIGAINVFMAHKIGCMFSKRNAGLFALFYAFTGSIWFFSSIPESYGLTSLCIALYLYASYCWTKSMEIRAWWVMVLLMVLGTLNEIVFPVIVVVPLICLGKRIMSFRTAGLIFAHLVISAIIVMCVEEKITEQRVHCQFLKYLSKVPRHESITVYHKDLIKYSWPEQLKKTVLNLSLFPVAYPSSSSRYIEPLFPDYPGYFKPSLMQYFHRGLSSAAILLIIISLCRSLCGFYKGDKMLFVALLSYVLLRIGLVFIFNPAEAFLYSAPIMLPLVLLVSYGLLVSHLQKDKCLFLLLVGITFLNNLSYFLKSFT